MSKLDQLKAAMKNPPAERLCLINANGFKLNLIASIVVSMVVIQTPYWYLSLIFLFSSINHYVGYKREMTQYNVIVQAKKQAGIYQEINEDPSPTRRRMRYIDEKPGPWLKYVIIAIISLSVVLLQDIGSLGWSMRILAVFEIIILYLFIYLGPVYWIVKLFRRGK